MQVKNVIVTAMKHIKIKFYCLTFSSQMQF